MGRDDWDHWAKLKEAAGKVAKEQDEERKYMDSRLRELSAEVEKLKEQLAKTKQEGYEEGYEEGLGRVNSLSFKLSESLRENDKLKEQLAKTKQEVLQSIMRQGEVR